MASVLPDVFLSVRCGVLGMIFAYCWGCLRYGCFYVLLFADCAKSVLCCHRGSETHYFRLEIYFPCNLPSFGFHASILRLFAFFIDWGLKPCF